MSNRKAAEQAIYQFISEMDISGYNLNIYKTIFSKLSDKEFHSYMEGLRDGTKYLVAFKEPFGKDRITLEGLLDLAEKHGIELFNQLIYQNRKGLPDYITPNKYLVLDMNIRRQSQNLIKKINIPDSNKVIDTLTYQPTGESKGSKVSYPELQLLASMGLDRTAEELIKYRGGDKGGFTAYNSMMLRYGTVRLGSIEPFSSGVESTKTLKSYLLAMHLRNTL